MITHPTYYPHRDICCTVEEFLEKMQKESGIRVEGNNPEEVLEAFIVKTGYAEYFKPKAFDCWITKMIHVAHVNGIDGLMPTRVFENEVEEIRFYASRI
jgi:hypothetical protein